MNEIMVVNDANFDGVIQPGKTVVVDFWAPSCAPCKLMEPSLQTIADSFKNQIRVVKVNVNENPKLSSRYLIRTLPTLLFIKDGQVKSQLIGAVNSKQIERVLLGVL